MTNVSLEISRDQQIWHALNMDTFADWLNGLGKSESLDHCTRLMHGQQIDVIWHDGELVSIRQYQAPPTDVRRSGR